MHLHKIQILLLTLCGLLAANCITTSCSDDDDNIILGGGNHSSNNSDTTNVNANTYYDYSKRMEVPALRSGSGIYFVSHTANKSNSNRTQVGNYCLEYDSAAYHSRWVAFRFDGETSSKSVSRSDEPFTEDTALPSSCRLGSRAYSGSGYNRGHLCASSDRLYSTDANTQTFYMTNMSPQLPSFNQGYWITLENLVQNWGRFGSFDTLYVCKGGTIKSGQRKSDSPLVTTNTQGRTANVVIPQYYFMAILGVRNGSYRAIGFWMEHKEYGYSYSGPVATSVMKTHAMSIDKLESLTGIDFFCNLPDATETSVEASFSTASWDW